MTTTATRITTTKTTATTTASRITTISNERKSDKKRRDKHNVKYPSSSSSSSASSSSLSSSSRMRSISSSTGKCCYLNRINIRIYLSIIHLSCYLMMMMMVVAGGGHMVNGLKCYCNPKECDIINSSDCPGKGLMLWDPCNCCRICAKIVGESCGGPGGFSGDCEPPLQCVTKLPITSGLGVCMDLQHLTAVTFESNRNNNCTDGETIVMAPGCEITNRRCQCWPTMRTCLSQLPADGVSPNDSRWQFKNLEDCQLNLQNLIKLELDFDEDYKISPSTFTYKKLRRKRKSLRKRIIILGD